MINRKSHFEMQREFMEAGDMLSDDPIDSFPLAYSLVDEEVNKELLPAFKQLEKLAKKFLADVDEGITPEVELNNQAYMLETLRVEVADGIVDSVYVLYQMANTLSLPFDELFAEVHRSNMSKFHKDAVGNLGVKKREDGKILKPESYSPPQLKQIIEAADNRNSEPSVVEKLALELLQVLDEGIKARQNRASMVPIKEANCPAASQMELPLQQR